MQRGLRLLLVGLAAFVGTTMASVEASRLSRLRAAPTRRPRRRRDRRGTRGNVPDATRPISADPAMRRLLPGQTSSRNGDRER